MFSFTAMKLALLQYDDNISSSVNLLSHSNMEE